MKWQFQEGKSVTYIYCWATFSTGNAFIPINKCVGIHFGQFFTSSSGHPDMLVKRDLFKVAHDNAAAHHQDLRTVRLKTSPKVNSKKG
jgi:hypothetical protein